MGKKKGRKGGGGGDAPQEEQTPKPSQSHEQQPEISQKGHRGSEGGDAPQPSTSQDQQFETSQKKGGEGDAPQQQEAAQPQPDQQKGKKKKGKQWKQIDIGGLSDQPLQVVQQKGQQQQEPSSVGTQQSMPVQQQQSQQLKGQKAAMPAQHQQPPPGLPPQPQQISKKKGWQTQEPSSVGTQQDMPVQQQQSQQQGGQWQQKSPPQKQQPPSEMSPQHMQAQGRGQGGQWQQKGQKAGMPQQQQQLPPGMPPQHMQMPVQQQQQPPLGVSPQHMQAQGRGQGGQWQQPGMPPQQQQLPPGMLPQHMQMPVQQQQQPPLGVSPQHMQAQGRQQVQGRGQQQQAQGGGQQLRAQARGQPVMPSQLPQSPPGLSHQQQTQQKGPQQPPGQHRQDQGQLQQQRPSTSHQPPVATMGTMSLGRGDTTRAMVPIRYGTKGRPIPIETNHLQLNVGNLKEAIHYDVDMVPDTPKKMLRGAMELFRQKYYPKCNPAFDGRKNLYSAKLLPLPNDIAEGEVIVDDGDRPRTFKITVKFANRVDLTPLHNMKMSQMSPQEALQCVDIVLRSAPARLCIQVGRSFFTEPRERIIELGEGMQMYYGFYQSAVHGWKPLLNVDVAHKAFPKAMNVLDALAELFSDFRNKYTRNNFRDGRPLPAYQVETATKFLKTLRVSYEIRGQPGSRRVHRVNGLGQCAKDAKFTQDDGRVLTVEQYFANVKHVRLEYPNMPTLWVGSQQRPTKILLPMEFCTVVGGQVLNRKMTENQTSAMIKYAATNTKVRKEKIMASLQSAKHNQDACVREFGFSISPDFEKITARVLQPPQLTYNGAGARVSRGVWRTDNLRFLEGAKISKWTIVVADRYEPRNLNELSEKIFNLGTNYGIKFDSRATQPFEKIGGRLTFEDVRLHFQTRCRGFDLVFVIIPNSGPQYSYVKRAAELNVGCLTQCIKLRTMNKLDPSTVGNILLKVNSKRNGKNHCLSVTPAVLKRPCMIMGADVTHPSPDSRDIPSVAAVTASHEPKAFCYNICCRLQPPKVEIIEDLKAITIEHLIYFEQKNRTRPERIVFFRDGVSEGQFDQVRDAEIMAIRMACKSLGDGSYEPKITFLVVQKRHHTRFFPLNERDSEDRNMNVPAGTCVDKDITNPTMQDFYLVSHASIQGVAKPTKYCTLWDDNDMSNDEIEELTYHLCHMFTRCNRSVSYPAPTYYAHLAAARAKVYIENVSLDLSQLAREQNKIMIQDVVRKECPMFFV